MSVAESILVRCDRHRDDGDEEWSSVPTLVLPLRGVFRYADRSQAVVADANTALLLHPAESYTISHPADGGDVCVALRIDYDVVVDALGTVGVGPAAWTLPGPLQPQIAERATVSLDARDALAAEEAALDVLDALSGAAPVPSGDRYARRIDAVRERLAADVAASATLAELGSDCGLSPYHLARRFRARTGTSLHQYRLALRFAAARRMLAEGATDITHVALATGFANHAHFSTAFRRAHGTTPSAWRERTTAR